MHRMFLWNLDAKCCNESLKRVPHDEGRHGVGGVEFHPVWVGENELADLV